MKPIFWTVLVNLKRGQMMVAAHPSSHSSPGEGCGNSLRSCLHTNVIVFPLTIRPDILKRTLPGFQRAPGEELPSSFVRGPLNDYQAA
ncbi:hypothetical protein AVEN_139506-1 [Araneus ventricosus]|uniref:Uncharacterized protein n=1 Tax=Araneus ventricosus TaxID=182803 RepID=A0A4Y2IEL4_ARAVE|nr:hypothetical protein AVEN_139506-1 [Araneus ventricosus]